MNPLKAQPHALDFLAIHEGPHAAQPDAAIDHLSGDAELLPDLQGPRLNANHPALGQRLRQFIDDVTQHTMPSQIRRHHKAHWPGPHDEHLGIRRVSRVLQLLGERRY
jgi:hypothetical protein